MSDAARGQVATEAAMVYERFFVPALFDQWPDRIMDRVGVEPGDRVLDVGCGTGVVGRSALGRVGPAGAVVGLDPNDGMLTVARGLSSEIEWKRGFAEDMPFADGGFDVALSQHALMFFEDRSGGITEMARVVRPGGSVGVATWASAESSPGYAAMIELIDDLFGNEAADALRAPFDIGTTFELRSLLEPSLHDVFVEVVDGIARFDSVEAWVTTDVRGWTLSEMIDDVGFDQLLAASVDGLHDFVKPDGSVEFAAPAVIGVGSVL